MLQIASTQEQGISGRYTDASMIRQLIQVWSWNHLRFVHKLLSSKGSPQIDLCNCLEHWFRKQLRRKHSWDWDQPTKASLKHLETSFSNYFTIVRGMFKPQFKIYGYTFIPHNGDIPSTSMEPWYFCRGFARASVGSCFAFASLRSTVASIGM